MKYLKFLALLPPAAALSVLLAQLFIVNVLPFKYFILIIVATIIIIAISLILLTRRHLAPQIIAIVIDLLIAAACIPATIYLGQINTAIDNFAATAVVKSEETGTANIATDPFVILINGIDAMANGDLDGKGNSDVNQIAVVNPETHKILLVNTPRDYYVYLHGVTEMRDKLTHAGYYGLEMSRLTLEDLYSINIDYYVRINFESLVELVDLIGGIDIESDVAFKTQAGIYIKKGHNHLDGKAALAYSRERKSIGGDTYRAEDQQQVIIAIFNKITHSSALLSNFSGILSALQNSFRTDINIVDLKQLVKNQLDQMPDWQIERTAVTGQSVYTRDVYSLKPLKNPAYVVVPDEKSVTAARDWMLEVLDRYE